MIIMIIMMIMLRRMMAMMTMKKLSLFHKRKLPNAIWCGMYLQYVDTWYGVKDAFVYMIFLP